MFPKGSYLRNDVPTRATREEDAFVRYPSIFGFAVVRCEIVTQTLSDMKSALVGVLAPVLT